jgi:hypothetical protein
VLGDLPDTTSGFAKPRLEHRLGERPPARQT